MPKKFTCPDCNATYNDLRGLGVHKSKVHGIKGTSKGAILYQQQNGHQTAPATPARVPASTVTPAQVMDMQNAHKRLASASLSLSCLMVDSQELFTTLQPALSHARAAMEIIKLAQAKVLKNLVNID